MYKQMKRHYFKVLTQKRYKLMMIQKKKKFNNYNKKLSKLIKIMNNKNNSINN